MVKHLEENIQATSSDAAESSAACIYENPRLSVDATLLRPAREQ